MGVAGGIYTREREVAHSGAAVDNVVHAGKCVLARPYVNQIVETRVHVPSTSTVHGEREWLDVTG